jgi:3-oxoacyl-[acyl-carrier protein] reductase
MDNLVALVTGASRGIGRAIAIKFAKEGMNLVLTARDKQKLNEVADEIRLLSQNEPIIIPADLRDAQQISNVIKETIKKWNRIDVLVNNAGLGYLKPFLEITPDEFQEMLDVNIRAVFTLTQKVVPYMIKNKSGNIINIASLAGKNGFKMGTGYAATKWALRGFAQCLMLELREHDIRVLTIFPSSVDTSFGTGGRSVTGTPPKNKIQPDDIANTAYLAVSMPERTMVSEIDMRPSNPQKI